ITLRRTQVCATVRSRLVTEEIVPAPVEVKSARKEVVHVVPTIGAVEVLNLFLTGHSASSQLVAAAGFRFQIIQHGTQLLHQSNVSRAIVHWITKVWRRAVTARKFPVNVYTVKEFPRFEETLHRSNERVTIGFGGEIKEWVRKRPATDRRND